MHTQGTRGEREPGLRSLPEGMTVAHRRAPYRDVLRGMAVSKLTAGSALAGINININILISIFCFLPEAEAYKQGMSVCVFVCVCVCPASSESRKQKLDGTLFPDIVSGRQKSCRF